ncbi:unnamed protein product [Prorocentrum cordatum]|uniref:Uncharacterized protein n=1 Tax=Prorocentrum cordatum TaxID=2364126 RepID=A0ABN9RYS6_9DINO|nr:unnamed protein product [Polarella glacialis]
MHAESSCGSAEEVQTESIGIVQFDNAVIYAEEGQSLMVHIMRLGERHSVCSGDYYETGDSEMWGDICEALKGTAHFKPGERNTTSSLQFFEDSGYPGSTVEASIQVSSPHGCVLGAVNVKQVRVELLDNHTSPRRLQYRVREKEPRF